MKKYYWMFKLLAVIAIIASFCSCKKEIELKYSGLTGELKGTVTLYDERTKVTDCSGVTVTVEGSSPKLQATTNEKGEFDIKGLKTGIYDIVFTKSGYGTYKRVSYQFIGGSISSYAYGSLYKLPDVKILGVKVDVESTNHVFNLIYVSGTLSEETRSISLQYYISDSPDVSYTSYQATGFGFFYDVKDFGFRLRDELLYKFPQGKQLFIRVYPVAETSFPYMDLTTGLSIYPVNPDCASEVIPFMKPKTISNY